MRIQARYWDCMRGLVQQQFKLLAAAAARQEQLAAMKARRAEAAAHMVVSADGEGLSPHNDSRGLCDGPGDEGGLDGDAEADEDAALLGGVVLRHPHHTHLRPPAGATAMECLDEETDTPHQRESVLAGLGCLVGPVGGLL